MAQSKMTYLDLVNSFYLALEENESSENLDTLAQELSEFGFLEKELYAARNEATQLFSKNCF